MCNPTSLGCRKELDPEAPMFFPSRLEKHPQDQCSEPRLAEDKALESMPKKNTTASTSNIYSQEQSLECLNNVVPRKAGRAPKNFAQSEARKTLFCRILFDASPPSIIPLCCDAARSHQNFLPASFTQYRKVPNIPTSACPQLQRASSAKI